MLTENLINKIHITSEARFDFEEMEIGAFPAVDIKRQIEDYLEIIQSEGRRLNWYQRIKYLDETSGEMLLLFIKTAQRFGNMRLWTVVGIMREFDYDDFLEWEGQNKAWYETKIEDLPNEDWVVDYYARLAEQERLRKLVEAEEAVQ